MIMIPILLALSFASSIVSPSAQAADSHTHPRDVRYQVCLELATQQALRDRGFDDFAIEVTERHKPRKSDAELAGYASHDFIATTSTGSRYTGEIYLQVSATPSNGPTRYALACAFPTPVKQGTGLSLWRGFKKEGRKTVSVEGQSALARVDAKKSSGTN